MVVNCQHVWREISNYLDGEVDVETRAAMEAHFAECKHCTAVLDGARNVVQLYGDDRLFELPAGFSRRLQRRLAPSSGFAGWRSFWMLAVAAAALIAGAVTFGNSSVFAHPDMRSRLAQPPHKMPPDLMVVLSSEGRIFHVPGCKYLHNKVGEKPELMSASEAMREGYAPCPRCLRQYLSAQVECPRNRGNMQVSRLNWVPTRDHDGSDRQTAKSGQRRGSLAFVNLSAFLGWERPERSEGRCPPLRTALSGILNDDDSSMTTTRQKVLYQGTALAVPAN